MAMYLWTLSVFQEYFKLRSKSIAQLKDKGDNPYPHKFHVQISLTEFIEKYNDTPAGETHDVEVSVAGQLNTNGINQLYYCLEGSLMYNHNDDKDLKLTNFALIDVLQWSNKL